MNKPKIVEGHVPHGNIYKPDFFIYDGDGFEFNQETPRYRRVKIRMFGIDAPERGQPYFTLAREALVEFIFKKHLWIKTYQEDCYGRVIGMVYTSDPEKTCNPYSINRQMVIGGHAWSTDFFDDEMEYAQENKLGLWAPPVAPWDFRKKNS